MVVIAYTTDDAAELSITGGDTITTDATHTYRTFTTVGTTNFTIATS